MAVENFGTWTEDDAGTGLSQTATKSSFSPLDFDLDARLYKDGGGAGFYDAFEHRVEVEITSHSGYAMGRGGLLMYSDDLGYLGAPGPIAGCGLGITWGDDTKNLLALERSAAEDWYSDAYVAAEDVIYFCKIEYADNSLEINIYDADTYAGGDLLDTLTLTLQEDYGGFRYIYCPVTTDDSDADNCTGYCQNLDRTNGNRYPVYKPKR